MRSGCGAPTRVNEPLARLRVTAQLGHQIITNGNEARAPFAVANHQDAVLEVDVCHTQSHRLAQPLAKRIVYPDCDPCQRGRSIRSFGKEITTQPQYSADGRQSQ